MDNLNPEKDLIPAIKQLCTAGEYDQAISLTNRISNKTIAIKAHLLCIEHEYRRFLDGLSKATKVLNESELEQRIFSGSYPVGIVYADRKVMSGGDYKHLAFLAYSTLELTFSKDCPAQLKAYIKKDAAKLQVRSGEPFQISTAGQFVTLGSSLAPANAN